MGLRIKCCIVNVYIWLVLRNIISNCTSIHSCIILLLVIKVYFYIRVVPNNVFTDKNHCTYYLITDLLCNVYFQDLHYSNVFVENRITMQRPCITTRPITVGNFLSSNVHSAPTSLAINLI